MVKIAAPFFEQMQLGEIQLWRIANTAGRNAAYLMAPEGGLEWRQLAQDGVQFANANYQSSLNNPIYIAPGNRVDLLVKAPLSATSTSILVQPVMGRSQVKPTPANPTGPTGADPKPGVTLMSVKVTGPQVMRRVPGNPQPQPAEMQFLQQAPRQPKFLQDIGVDELMRNNFTTQKLVTVPTWATSTSMGVAAPSSGSAPRGGTYTRVSDLACWPMIFFWVMPLRKRDVASPGVNV